MRLESARHQCRTKWDEGKYDDLRERAVNRNRARCEVLPGSYRRRRERAAFPTQGVNRRRRSEEADQQEGAPF